MAFNIQCSGNVLRIKLYSISDEGVNDEVYPGYTAGSYNPDVGTRYESGRLFHGYEPDYTGARDSYGQSPMMGGTTALGDGFAVSEPGMKVDQWRLVDEATRPRFNPDEKKKTTSFVRLNEEALEQEKQKQNLNIKNDNHGSTSVGTVGAENRQADSKSGSGGRKFFNVFLCFDLNSIFLIDET